MKPRAKVIVSVRETAVYQMSVNKKRRGAPCESIRVETQAMAILSASAGEGGLVEARFAGIGLWGSFHIPQSDAVQFAIGLLQAAGAGHLVMESEEADY